MSKTILAHTTLDRYDLWDRLRNHIDGFENGPVDATGRRIIILHAKDDAILPEMSKHPEIIPIPSKTSGVVLDDSYGVSLLSGFNIVKGDTIGVALQKLYQQCGMAALSPFLD